jgi:hypothetical protein
MYLTLWASSKHSRIAWHTYQMLRPPIQTLNVLHFWVYHEIVVFCSDHLAINMYGNWSFLANPLEECGFQIFLLCYKYVSVSLVFCHTEQLSVLKKWWTVLKKSVHNFFMFQSWQAIIFTEAFVSSIILKPKRFHSVAWSRDEHFLTVTICSIVINITSSNSQAGDTIRKEINYCTEGKFRWLHLIGISHCLIFGGN